MDNVYIRIIMIISSQHKETQRLASVASLLPHNIYQHKIYQIHSASLVAPPIGRSCTVKALGAARAFDFRWVTSTVAGQSIQIKFANSRIDLASQHVAFNSEVLEVAQLTDGRWDGTGELVGFETDLGEGRQIEEAGGQVTRHEV